MTEVPVIISEERQPNSASGHPKKKHHAKSSTVVGETSELLSYRSGYIILESTTAEPVAIEVLADEAAPTPSGGYAKWVHIPRPHRTAITVFEGYEPMVLTVPILFDAVRKNGEQEDVENQIQWLEWMGGRGIKEHEGYRSGFGKPPLLTVYSARGSEKASPLIPLPFQAKHLQWYIDDITFDEHPLRSSGGSRIRQAAVVKLVQYVTDPPIKEKADPITGDRTYFTTATLNTVKGLVAHYLAGKRGRLHDAVHDTLHANRHNKAIGTNPGKPLKPGTRVRIPKKYLVPE